MRELPLDIKDPSAGAGTSWDAEVGAVRVLFGPGRLLDAANAVGSLGCASVLLVSDPGLEAAGHLAKLATALESGGLEVATFSEVSENPTTDQVEEGLAFALPRRPDCIVALGGGSAMDCAKGINLLLTNGGRITDYEGFGHTTRPLLPSIGIPTTAGTGSEAQSFALISDSVSHKKMACGTRGARFRIVILDPSLLSSVPVRVAATSGLDAVSHALESFVSTRRNPVGRMFGKQAWHLLQRHLEDSMMKDAPPEALGHVLLGAHLAGAAIEQSMLGAAHACANPLTARFGITHGQAVALMLPAVIRFNSPVADNDYRELAGMAESGDGMTGSEVLARRVEKLRRDAGLPESLQLFDVPRTEIPSLASAANLEWTARFNPRPVTQVGLEEIYEAAF